MKQFQLPTKKPVVNNLRRKYALVLLRVFLKFPSENSCEFSSCPNPTRVCDLPESVTSQASRKGQSHEIFEIFLWMFTARI